MCRALTCARGLRGKGLQKRACCGGDGMGVGVPIPLRGKGSALGPELVPQRLFVGRFVWWRCGAGPIAHARSVHHRLPPTLLDTTNYFVIQTTCRVADGIDKSRVERRSGQHGWRGH